MSRTPEELRKLLEQHQKDLISLGVSKESAELLTNLDREENLEAFREPEHI